MRKQVELTFVIGFDKKETVYQIEKYIKHVVSAGTTLCGGCTTSFADGYWRTDGAEKQKYFHGNQQQETAFILNLTCELEKEQHVYQYMKKRIKSVTTLLGVDVDWVHVKRTEFVGMHFSVKEMDKEQSAEQDNCELFRKLIAMGSVHINRSADEMKFRNKAEDLYENLFGKNQ